MPPLPTISAGLISSAGISEPMVLSDLPSRIQPDDHNRCVETVGSRQGSEVCPEGLSVRESCPLSSPPRPWRRSSSATWPGGMRSMSLPPPLHSSFIGRCSQLLGTVDDRREVQSPDEYPHLSWSMTKNNLRCWKLLLVMHRGHPCSACSASHGRNFPRQVRRRSSFTQSPSVLEGGWEHLWR